MIWPGKSMEAEPSLSLLGGSLRSWNCRRSREPWTVETKEAGSGLKPMGKSFRDALHQTLGSTQSIRSSHGRAGLCKRL